MKNRNLVFIFIIFTFSFSTTWLYYTNNPWSINMSSRSSGIGGITLESYNHLNQDDNLTQISVFNSNMFGNLINYSNIFLTHKINKIVILGNSFNRIKIGMLSRKINNIPSTQYAWNEIIFNEPLLSDIDYDLIEYYDHKDISLLLFIPFSNKYGNFAINLRPSYSKLAQYSANTFAFDLTYSKLYMEKFYFGMIFGNLFSYKKWSTGHIEKFYPSLSTLLNYNYSDISIFIQLDNLYFDTNYLKSTYDILNSLKLGFEYTIYNEFDLRMGYNEYFYTIGIGIKIYNILFDYTYLYHQDLDQSHQLTISFLIKNK